MKLKKLIISNYRCFKEAEIDFDDYITLVVGKNGAGKTAILDAVAVSVSTFLLGTDNPFDEVSVRKIKYKTDGSIYSDDVEINKDVTETLNLNCEALSLPQIRKNVLMTVQDRITKKCKGKSQDAFMRELERTYASLVQERKLTPYCGIIISWLESKLKIS